MAIAFVQGTTTTNSASGTGTGVFNANSMTVAPNQLLYLWTWNQAGTAQSPVFSDTVNSGNWTNIGSANDGSRYIQSAYKVCNASGTLGASGIAYSGMPNGSSNNVAILQFNGFLGTPTYAGTGGSDATVVLHTGSSSTAVAGTSFNTSKSSELVIANVADLGAQAWGTAPAAPWVTPTMGGGGQNLAEAASFYQIFSSAASAAQLTGTLAVADFWFVSQVGFYDAVPV